MYVWVETVIMAQCFLFVLGLSLSFYFSCSCNAAVLTLLILSYLSVFTYCSSSSLFYPLQYLLILLVLLFVGLFHFICASCAHIIPALYYFSACSTSVVLFSLLIEVFLYLLVCQSFNYPLYTALLLSVSAESTSTSFFLFQIMLL